jgi:hypothetical protein
MAFRQPGIPKGLPKGRLALSPVGPAFFRGLKNGLTFFLAKILDRLILTGPF